MRLFLAKCRWQFKADLTTYHAAVARFVTGIRSQLKEWEDENEAMNGTYRINK